MLSITESLLIMNFKPITLFQNTDKVVDFSKVKVSTTSVASSVRYYM